MKEICPYYRGRDKCMEVCISRTQKTVHHRDVHVLKELGSIRKLGRENFRKYSCDRYWDAPVSQ